MHTHPVEVSRSGSVVGRGDSSPHTPGGSTPGKSSGRESDSGSSGSDSGSDSDGGNNSDQNFNSLMFISHSY